LYWYGITQPVAVAVKVILVNAGCGEVLSAESRAEGLAEAVVVKFAVTTTRVFPLTVHGAVPAQPPLQPVKAAPDAAVAVRVTMLLVGKLAEHVAPHVMPAGLLVTVPVPVPAFATVTASEATTGLAQASLEYVDSPVLANARTR
jgi:hypothetical protein